MYVEKGVLEATINTCGSKNRDVVKLSKNRQNKRVDFRIQGKYLISDMNTGSIVYTFEKDGKIFYGLYILAKDDNNIVYFSYTSSTNYFYKNLWQVEEMINALEFKL